MVAKRSPTLQWVITSDTSEDTVLLLPQKKFKVMVGNEKNKSVLKLSQKVAYGVGHVMNDICAAIWFSYTLLFFEVVLEVPSSLAGVLIFIGQVADAIASPVIGVLVDRYGTRKSWHMFGTALIAFSFSLIFSNCPWHFSTSVVTLNTTDYESLGSQEYVYSANLFFEIFYYAVLVVIFQTGWATVQIAHLAIIPDMTPDKSGRADLTAIRYTATVCSSVFVYLVTWFILHITEGSKPSLGPGDSYKFKDIVLIGLLIGGTLTMLFHAILKVPNDSSSSDGDPYKVETSWFSVIKEYFKSWPLYQVTMLYFSSRMILNISLVYMPMYLVEKIGDKAEYIATVPLVSYIASFIASLGVRQVRSFCSSKTNYLVGGLLSIGASVWIGVGIAYSAELFGVSILLGAGSSITGVASLCLCADLIGMDTKNGAFVYSIVTAVDKLLGGVVVIIIEIFKHKSREESSHYYQDVLAYGCGLSTILGLLALFTMYCNSKQLSQNKLPNEVSESVQT